MSSRLENELVVIVVVLLFGGFCRPENCAAPQTWRDAGMEASHDYGNLPLQLAGAS